MSHGCHSKRDDDRPKNCTTGKAWVVQACQTARAPDSVLHLSRLNRWDFAPHEPRPQTLTQIVSRVSRWTHLTSLFNYCKTPLISTYVFSGLATVQVLIFGAVLTFGGYDKAGWKIQQGRSLFNLVISVEKTLLCMFQRLCTYFQDTGVLIFGGMYFRGIAADSKFQEKMKGYLFSEGTDLRGFTVVVRALHSERQERRTAPQSHQGKANGYHKEVTKVDSKVTRASDSQRPVAFRFDASIHDSVCMHTYGRNKDKMPSLNCHACMGMMWSMPTPNQR